MSLLTVQVRYYRVGSRSISENFCCAAGFKLSLTKFEQEEEDYPKIRKWVRIRTRRKRRKIALVPPLPRLTSILTIGISLFFFWFCSVSLFTTRVFINFLRFLLTFQGWAFFKWGTLRVVQRLLSFSPPYSSPYKTQFFCTFSLSVTAFIYNFFGAFIGIACVEFTNFLSCVAKES